MRTEHLQRVRCPEPLVKNQPATTFKGIFSWVRKGPLWVDKADDSEAASLRDLARFLAPLRSLRTPFGLCRSDLMKWRDRAFRWMQSITVSLQMLHRRGHPLTLIDIGMVKRFPNRRQRQAALAH